METIMIIRIVVVLLAVAAIIFAWKATLVHTGRKQFNETLAHEASRYIDLLIAEEQGPAAGTSNTIPQGLFSEESSGQSKAQSDLQWAQRMKAEASEAWSAEQWRNFYGLGSGSAARQAQAMRALGAVDEFHDGVRVQLESQHEHYQERMMPRDAYVQALRKTAKPLSFAEWSMALTSMGRYSKLQILGFGLPESGKLLGLVAVGLIAGIVLGLVIAAVDTVLAAAIGALLGAALYLVLASSHRRKIETGGR